MSETNIVETIARAMQESDAWPVVFAPGSAESLARSAITALEANGYAIVPASATPEVLNVADKLDIPRRCAFEFYSRAIQEGKAKA